MEAKLESAHIKRGRHTPRTWIVEPTYAELLAAAAKYTGQELVLLRENSRTAVYTTVNRTHTLTIKTAKSRR